MTISKKGVANGDPLELLKLAYALNQEKLKSEFNKIGLQILSDEDLSTLADIVNKKLDVSGNIKSGDNVIMFDTLRILDGIKYTQQEKDNVLNNTTLFVQ